VGVELEVLSKTKTVTGGHLVVEDYDENPVLCRRGVWVGWKETFVQTVTLGYEHEGYDLVVGWAVNGQMIVDPGYGDVMMFPEPCPGLPSIRYRCPVEGHWLTTQAPSCVCEAMVASTKRTPISPSTPVGMDRSRTGSRAPARRARNISARSR
jgi:hypothetical protein